jgi:hypothetical protein
MLKICLHAVMSLEEKIFSPQSGYTAEDPASLGEFKVIFETTVS